MGRIKTTEDSNQFSFSSILTDNLSLAIDIPFKGEETLIFHPEKPKGSIYRKTKASLRLEQGELRPKEFSQFVKEAALFFELLSRVKTSSCSQEKCQFGTVSEGNGRLIVKKELNSKVNLQLSFVDSRPDFFKRISMGLSRRGVEESLVKIDLKIKDCAQ